MKTKLTLFIAILFSFSAVLTAQDIPGDHWFWVKSAKNMGKDKQGTWDISGHPMEIKPGDKQSLKVWNVDGGPDRLIRFVKLSNGNYKIYPGHGYPSYAFGWDTGNNGNGSNIIIKKADAPGTEFKIEYTQNSLWRIYSTDGRVVCTQGKSTKNGTKVHLWENHDAVTTSWCLEIPYAHIIYEPGKPIKEPNPVVHRGTDPPGDRFFYIQSGNNVGKNWYGYWDVSGGPKSVKAGETQNIKVWKLDDGPDRKYKFKKLENGNYKIIPGHGKKGFAVRLDSKNNGSGSNFYIDRYDAPGTEFKVYYKGSGLYRILSADDNRVVCLSNRSSKNGSNVHMWGDHPGSWTEWALIETKSKSRYKPYEPKDLAHLHCPSGLTGPKSVDLLAKLDASYSELYKMEAELNNLNDPLRKTQDVINKTAVVSSRLNDLDNRVTRVHGVLSSFTKIPVIGGPVTALAVTLKQSKNQIDKVNNKVKKLEKPVLKPVADSFNGLAEASGGLEAQIAYLKTELADIKTDYISAGMCVADGGDQGNINIFETKSGSLAGRLAAVNNESANIRGSINSLKNICKKGAGLEKPVKKMEKGINKVSKAFDKADKAAKEVDKVLSKKFKKKIGFVKINISLKKVLTGGKVGKVFSKFVNKWVSKLVKPLTKKLNIKVPKVPGFEELEREMNSLKSSVAEIKQNADKLRNSANAIRDIKTRIASEAKECVDLPCGSSAMGG